MNEVLVRHNEILVGWGRRTPEDVRAEKDADRRRAAFRESQDELAYALRREGLEILSPAERLAPSFADVLEDRAEAKRHEEKRERRESEVAGLLLAGRQPRTPDETMQIFGWSIQAGGDGRGPVPSAEPVLTAMHASRAATVDHTIVERARARLAAWQALSAYQAVKVR
jgi:hypothetical protein